MTDGLSDRRQYILGWSNEQKIAVLEKELAETGRQKARIDGQIKANERQQDILKGKETALHDLLKFKGFFEIDWQRISRELDDWRKIKVEIEESSGELKRLQTRLRAVQSEMEAASSQKEGHLTNKGGVGRKIEETNEKMASCKETLSGVKPHEREQFFPAYALCVRGISKP